MQNPTTPTLSPDDRLRTSSTAPDMSLAGPVELQRHHLLARLVGLGTTFVPRYRSGASATNPSAAKRSQTSSMCGTRPHHSWITMTPGPVARRRHGQIPLALGPVARKLDHLAHGRRPYP